MFITVHHWVQARSMRDFPSILSFIHVWRFTENMDVNVYASSEIIIVKFAAFLLTSVQTIYFPLHRELLYHPFNKIKKIIYANELEMQLLFSVLYSQCWAVCNCCIILGLKKQFLHKKKGCSNKTYVHSAAEQWLSLMAGRGQWSS
jgi:hypothetical protein